MNKDNAAAVKAQAQFQDASSLQKQGRLKEVQSIYEAILEIDPRQFDALHLLGVVAAQSKNYQLAADLIAKAIAINPNHSDFYSNRGLALQKLNQLDAAVASYDCAL